ncbi:MAG: YicC family protein [Desulfobacteraceae bacterium]|nr:YicC family protein [Desulfobacteraceae bacterium]
MIKSMTAFSEASYTENDVRAEVEIRSYNSKNFDVALYLPGFCRRFEDGIKKIVAANLARGRVEIRIAIRDESEDAASFAVDEKRADAYYKALATLRQNLAIESPITLDHVLAGRDMILDEEKETDFDLLWQVVSTAVTQSLAALTTMRANEGENLAGDLEERMTLIEGELKTIEDRAAEIPKIYRERLMERISRLTDGVEALDPVRLSQEAAILADKSDISEEIVRVHSHIKQFREILSSSKPAGRKLNFLIQEFNREFNTMGSKSGQAELSHTIVNLKSELEKIREQVQNIE